MKNRKLLVLILALSLLLCAVIGISASAEDEKTPDIISHNVQYDEVFSLMYAVDAASVKEAPVTLNLYYDDPASGAEIKKSYTAYEPRIERIDGVETLVYVFTTEGVAAKFLDKNFYVQAVDKSGAVSEVERYSVLEYLLVRLYGGQTITEGQRALYEDVISFASSAQRVLINERGGDTDPTNDVPLANTYSLAEIVNGVICETKDVKTGYTQGVYPAGTKIYPYKEGYNGSWRVTTSDGTSIVENGAEVTVDGYTVIKEYIPNVAGQYYANYGGISYDTLNVIKDLEVAKLLNRATYQIKDPDTIEKWDGTNDYILLDNDNGNKVMKLATKEAEQGSKASIYFFNTNENTGNCYVFETKIKVEFDETTAAACADKTTPLVAHFQVATASPNGGSASGNDTGVASSGFARIYAKIGDDDKLHYYMNHTNYSTDANILNADAEITEGWHTFTAEMYENGWVKTYVDGVLVGTSKCISNADLNGTASNGFKFSDVNSIKVQLGNTGIGGDVDNSAIYFDNTFLGKVDKAYE